MIEKMVCEFCGRSFSRYTKPCIKKKNKRIYCSRKCFSNAQRKDVFTVCAYCGKEIVIKPSRIKEFNFCNRKCKEAAQSLKSGEKFLGMIPSHYSTGTNSINTYRENALGFYGEKCRICGYAVSSCLEVHHKDCNRNNNRIENLDVLCPTHHKEYQYGIRKY
jgi:hypothetical protein